MWNPLLVPMYSVRERRSRASSRGATPVFGGSSRGTTPLPPPTWRSATPDGLEGAARAGTPLFSASRQRQRASSSAGAVPGSVRFGTPGRPRHLPPRAQTPSQQPSSSAVAEVEAKGCELVVGGRVVVGVVKLRSSADTAYARTQLLRAADPVGKLVHAEVPHQHTPHPMQHLISIHCTPCSTGIAFLLGSALGCALIRMLPSARRRPSVLAQPSRALGALAWPRQVAALGPRGLLGALGALGLLAAAPLAEEAAAARAPAWDSVHVALRLSSADAEALAEQHYIQETVMPAAQLAARADGWNLEWTWRPCGRARRTEAVVFAAEPLSLHAALRFTRPALRVVDAMETDLDAIECELGEWPVQLSLAAVSEPTGASGSSGGDGDGGDSGGGREDGAEMSAYSRCALVADRTHYSCRLLARLSSALAARCAPTPTPAPAQSCHARMKAQQRRVVAALFADALYQPPQLLALVESLASLAPLQGSRRYGALVLTGAEGAGKSLFMASLVARLTAWDEPVAWSSCAVVSYFAMPGTSVRTMLSYAAAAAVAMRRMYAAGQWRAGTSRMSCLRLWAPMRTRR